MNNNKCLGDCFAWLPLFVAIVCALGVHFPTQGLAQVPARFYWKTLSNAIAVPIIFESVCGNTNPFDPSHNVTPGADFDATVSFAGYARTFALFDRSAMAAILLPMGKIYGDVTVAGRTFNQSASGFGNPMLEVAINALGLPAQNDLPALIRYEPRCSVDLLADLALPIGENDDFVGQTMKTDPMFQVDAHLTRDFTEHFWGSLDMAWFTGGEASIDGVEGEALNNIGVGLTFGYTVNENLNLTVSYKSTIDDDASDDLSMDMFMASLVYGWHPLIEGSRRLQESGK